MFFHIDNEAARYVVDKGTSRCAPLMVAQREMVLTQLRHGFRLRGKYIRSEDNVIGDSLSRLKEPSQWERFVNYAINVVGAVRLEQVEPKHNVAKMVQRMRRAQRNAAAAEAKHMATT